MDADVRNRSFQDTAMTLRQLIGKVMEPYPSKQLLFSIPDVEMGRIAIQYQETDWAFLNRLLSGHPAIYSVPGHCACGRGKETEGSDVLQGGGV